MFNVLVRSLLKDLRKNLGSWTHVNSTLTKKISVTHTNFPPTVILGLFSVVIGRSSPLIVTDCVQKSPRTLNVTNRSSTMIV